MRSSAVAMAKVLPSAGTTIRSGSNTLYMLRTRPSKPLNTDSRMTMAATGTPTAKTLTFEMMLMTESELREVK